MSRILYIVFDDDDQTTTKYFDPRDTTPMPTLDASMVPNIINRVANHSDKMSFDDTVDIIDALVTRMAKEELYAMKIDVDKRNQVCGIKIEDVIFKRRGIK